jgi:RHS repeat-associated protein
VGAACVFRAYEDRDVGEVRRFRCVTPGQNFARDPERLIRRAPEAQRRHSDDNILIAVAEMPGEGIVGVACRINERTARFFGNPGLFPLDRDRGTNSSRRCTVNRYYDPSTDQFLSIDPDVTTTDQPYVFTNDDPLNTTDPLGMEALKSVVLKEDAAAKRCKEHPEASGCRGIDVTAVTKKVVKAAVSTVAQPIKSLAPISEDIGNAVVKTVEVTGCVAGSFWPSSSSLGAAGVTTGSGMMGTGAFLYAGSDVATGIVAGGIATGGAVFIVAGAGAIGYGAYEYFQEC